MELTALAPSVARSCRTCPWVGHGDTLLCVEEVAELLGVRPRFVRQLVAEHRVAFCKIGRYVRFEPDSVEQLTESGRIKRSPND